MEAHYITMKIQTLEVWCYPCNKWIGVYDSHPCERYFAKLVCDAYQPITVLSPMILSMVEENERRQRERRIYGLSKNDEFYFVSSNWWRLWRSFLVGNASYPPAIDNSILLENNQLMPHLSPMVDFHIFSRENWQRIQQIYGGGPEINEESLSGPQYLHLQSQLKLWRG
jgi:hypothetical protein